jgi:hypothetical protein
MNKNGPVIIADDKDDQELLQANLFLMGAFINVERYLNKYEGNPVEL